MGMEPFIRFELQLILFVLIAAFLLLNVYSKLLWSISWCQWKWHSKYASREHLLLEVFAQNWHDNFYLMMELIGKVQTLCMKARKSVFRLERTNGTGYRRPRSVVNPHLKPQNQCKNLEFRLFSFVYFWLESSLLK